ncbi:MAG TPA: ATP-binding protein [Gemmataceae bacterium]|nr:ATP-binding protein [Gemmataceae bacterium]
MPETPTDVGQLSNLQAGWQPASRPPLDSSQSALEFIHRLLILPSEEHADLDGLLDELSAAFAATAAGLATFPEGEPLGIHPPPMDDCRAMIDDLTISSNHQSSLGNRQCPRGALIIPRRGGGSCLLTLMGTPERGGWLLWLEDAGRTCWNPSEAGLLVLAGQALMHCWSREETPPPWAVQLDRGIRRQRMDATARVVRRLAHDFGNHLTGILGFSELALTQQTAPHSTLHVYLTEIHRGAQNGAQYTDQLRLLARRQSAANRSCRLADVLSGDEPKALATAADPSLTLPARPQSPLATRSDVQLKLNVPADLPAVAMEAEALRQALTIVLDNAREAIAGGGVIEVSARTIHVDAGQARRLLGDVRPGAHLEIRVADNGSGLTPEAQRLLFAEPFFSTKARKRGFGLALAYGILSAHRGGLELLRRPEGGTVARLLVPVAAVAAPSL